MNSPHPRSMRTSTVVFALFFIGLVPGQTRAQNPDESRLKNVTGLTYLYSRKFREAEREFAAAVRANPNYAPARFNLGKLYERQGKYVEALRQYRDAYRLEPDMPGVKEALSRLGFYIGPTKNPLPPGPGKTLGDGEFEERLAEARDLFAVGRYDDCRTYLDILIRKRPTQTELLLLYAKTYEKERAVGPSVDWYLRARQIDPANPQILIPLVRGLATQGRFDEAFNTAEDYISTTPDDPVMFRLMGRIELARGQKANAYRYLQEAARLSPEDEALKVEVDHLADEVGLQYYNQGLYHFQLQDWTRAKEALEKALDQGNLGPEESAKAQQFLVVARFSLARVRTQIAEIQAERDLRESKFLEDRLDFDDIRRDPAAWKSGKQVEFEGWIVGIEKKSEETQIIVSTDRQGRIDTSAGSNLGRRTDGFDAIPTIVAGNQTGAVGVLTNPAQTFRANVEMSSWFSIRVTQTLPEDPRIRANSLIKVIGKLEQPRIIRNPYNRLFSRYSQPTVLATRLEFRRETQITEAGGLASNFNGEGSSSGGQGISSSRFPFQPGRSTSAGLAGPLKIELLALDEEERRNK